MEGKNGGREKSGRRGRFGIGLWGESVRKSKAKKKKKK
jgi:hypothetical protein